MRLTSYGRNLRPQELPSFLIGGFYSYPRALVGLACPWNARILTFADIFIGTLWHVNILAVLFEPQARAVNEGATTTPNEENGKYNICINLFDTLLANPTVPRALAYELLGFAAGAKTYFRHSETTWLHLCACYREHRALVRDWDYLKALVRQPLPKDTPR